MLARQDLISLGWLPLIDQTDYFSAERIASMCPTTLTDEPDKEFPEAQDDNNGDREEEEEESKNEASKLPWPEENDSLSFLVQTWQRWTYGYMNPLLQKGSRQTLNDGTHISTDDLFRVPASMESAFLSDKFE